MLPLHRLQHFMPALKKNFRENIALGQIAMELKVFKSSAASDQHEAGSGNSGTIP